MLLADEFYLIAHDDTAGRRRLSPRTAGLGLAGALLGELVFYGRILVHHGRLVVLDRRPPADALAHTTMDQILAEPQAHTVRVWLAFLAEHAADAVGQRLERAGLVTPTRSRWRRRARYVPVDMSTAAWPEHRLRLHLARGEPLALTDAVLAGLVCATGLAAQVLWDTPASARHHLAHAIGGLPQPLRELTAHVETAVGAAVLSHRT